MIDVFYSHLDTPLSADREARWLAELPAEKRRQLGHLHVPADRWRSLLGYRLLKQACQVLGAMDFCLDAVHFTRRGKPCAPGIHFSISHSHRLVACAVSLHHVVGLDVEHIRPVDGARLVHMLSAEERRGIGDDTVQFFRLWTGKEAVAKAHGTGLADMGAIDFRHQYPPEGVFFRGQRWYLHTLDLQHGYVATLALPLADPPVHITGLSPAQLDNPCPVETRSRALCSP